MTCTTTCGGKPQSQSTKATALLYITLYYLLNIFILPELLLSHHMGVSKAWHPPVSHILVPPLLPPNFILKPLASPNESHSSLPLLPANLILHHLGSSSEPHSSRRPHNYLQTLYCSLWDPPSGSPILVPLTNTCKPYITSLVIPQ